MNSSGKAPDPFDVVARALQRPRECLTEESAIYRDHGWDSLGHLNVIMAIEEALGIAIENEEAWQLKNMKVIAEFFERHHAGSSGR